jgi:hypothetical protein
VAYTEFYRDGISTNLDPGSTDRVAPLVWRPHRSNLCAVSAATGTSFSIWSDGDGHTLFVLDEYDSRALEFPSLESAQAWAEGFDFGMALTTTSPSRS